MEDYADRVLGKVGEAYPNTEEDVAQALGTESFLRGCRDRSAAYAASEHKPDTIYKALQCVKDAAAKLRVFVRPAMTTHQVTFADPEKESITDGVAHLSKEQEKMMQLMTEMMSRLEKTHQDETLLHHQTGVKISRPLRVITVVRGDTWLENVPSPAVALIATRQDIWLRSAKRGKQGFGSPSVRKSVESSEGGSE